LLVLTIPHKCKVGYVRSIQVVYLHLVIITKGITHLNKWYSRNDVITAGTCVLSIYLIC